MRRWRDVGRAPARPDWPDPGRTAVGSAVLLAFATPLWPALLPAVAALSALGGLTVLPRLLGARTPPRASGRGGGVRIVAAIAAGWAGFFLLVGTPAALPALAVAGGTVAAHLLAGAGPEGAP